MLMGQMFAYLQGDASVEALEVQAAAASRSTSKPFSSKLEGLNKQRSKYSRAHFC